MTLYNLDAFGPSPCTTDTLAVLAEAMCGRIVPAAQRVTASADSRSPDEGLALLKAYVAISDRKVRQAILDSVIAITEGDMSGISLRR